MVAAALQVDPATLRNADRSCSVSRQRTLVTNSLMRRKGYGVGEVAAEIRPMRRSLVRYSHGLRTTCSVVLPRSRE